MANNNSPHAQWTDVNTTIAPIALLSYTPGDDTSAITLVRASDATYMSGPDARAFVRASAATFNQES